MAMQLTNIARDVAEDFHRGRQYLPSAWVAPATLRVAMTAAPGDASRAAVADAVARLLARAEQLYRRGFDGLSALGWRNALAIGAAGRIYRAIGRILARRAHDPLLGRAVVSLPRKLLATAAAALSLVRGLPGRWRERRTPLASPRTTLRFEHVVIG
jgi:phytoene synthase